MPIDNFDIKILRELNKLKDNEVITTWKMMRRIFPKGNNRENAFMKKRMDKMERMGLFLIEKNSPKKFSMIKDNVIFKKINFPDKKSDAILLRIKNKWEIFEI